MNKLLSIAIFGLICIKTNITAQSKYVDSLYAYNSRIDNNLTDSPNGLHRDKIKWINWYIPKSDIDQSNSLTNLANGITKVFKSSSGYIYTITIKDVKIVNRNTPNTLITQGENFKLIPSNTESYWGNNFKFGYKFNSKIKIGSGTNEMEVTDKNYFAIAPNNGHRAEFTLEVTGIDPTGKPITPKGIVIAGSETISSQNEFYELSVEQGGSVKIIDKYIYNNNWSNFNLNVKVSNSGRTIRAIGTENQGDGRGDVVLYAENASKATVTIQGGGGQHIALGFIEEVDYNDTPSSIITSTSNEYGNAYHMMDTYFDGNLVDGTYSIQGISNNAENLLIDKNKYWSVNKKPKYMMLGNEIGSDPGSFGLDQSDDDDSIPKEFDKLNQYFILEYKNETDLNGFINMWVDSDRNGKYDEHEKVVFIIGKNIKSNLLIDLKKYYTLTSGLNYHIRLRISSDNNLGPTGFASDGEVEDYVFEIAEKPNDIAGTVFIDKNGGIPNGEPLANVEIKLTKEGDHTFSQTFFTNTEGKFLFFNLYDGIYKIKVIKPFDKEFVSSSDNTPLDGETTVYIIKDKEQNINNVDFGVYNNVCFLPAIQNSNISNPTNHGITSLNRPEILIPKKIGVKDWPKTTNGAWTALESKSKGFVINRVSEAKINEIKNPIEGMMVYDTTNDCLKIYNGAAWKCLTQLGCPTN